MAPWHTRSLPEIARALETDLHAGLADDEARARLQTCGPNRLPEGKRDSLAIIFFEQFKSPLIYVLLLAGFLVFITGERIDSFIILFVIIFNAIVGTVQEGRAQNTLAALKKFTRTTAVVLREGRERVIPDEEVVPGDIIILHEGEKAPADARIIEAKNFRLDEAALTGESGAVHKIDSVLGKLDLTAAEQVNMVFKGTHVVGGNGRAVATETGVNTMIGKIGQTISGINTEIPLKADIRNLSRLIIAVVGVLSLFLFVLGISLGKSGKEMFSTVVSLSVSIIPEGLPIVITLVLATGMWRMSKRNALVKRLQAVEALGQARVVAVDKTGTITKNEMMVKEIFAADKTFEISGSGYEPKGDITLRGNPVYPLNHVELIVAGRIAAMNSNARIFFHERENLWRVAGDPTEAALLVVGEKIGIKKHELERESPQLAEYPFDYRTKYFVSSHRIEGRLLRGGRTDMRQFVSVTGVPEVLLARSEKIFFVPLSVEGAGGDVESLGHERRAHIEKAVRRMSERGLRVIAFAFLELPLHQNIESFKVENLIFGGLYGISDTLRPEVKESMKRAREAGIKVVMITGDHRDTAIAVAKEAGIYREGDRVLTENDIAHLRDRELEQYLANTTVFARITPEDKMKIIAAYRRRGEIVAMTGDGVNDAPSLVAADLGVAMGKIGTEVAKEASDIVLLDDNFGSIIAAVEEGRSIFKTIQKVILYLFSTSVGELLTIVGALALGYPLPLVPGQIIWLNLVTDGFLDVSLAMEPKEKGLLKGTFERPKKYLVDSSILQRIPGMAITMMIGSLILFRATYEDDLMKGWTMALTTLAIFQWFNAWNCRSETVSVFKQNPFANRFLVGATAIVIGLQILAVHAPFMNHILRTTPLTIGEWMLAAAVATSIIFAEEARKYVRRSLSRSRFLPSKA